MGTPASRTQLSNVHRRGYKGENSAGVIEADGGKWHPAGIEAGLSTQIIVTATDASGGEHQVGAIQTLTPTETRPLIRIQEVGTDGVLEIVPNAAFTVELAVTRLVFDYRRLPPAFARGFRHIHAQRLPFDIRIIDYNRYAEYELYWADGGGHVSEGGDKNDVDVVTYLTTNSSGDIDIKVNVQADKFVQTVYKNCWLTSYTYTYDQSNYLITESATIWAETVYDETSPLPIDFTKGDLLEMYYNATPESNAMATAFIGGRRIQATTPVRTTPLPTIGAEGGALEGRPTTT